MTLSLSDDEVFSLLERTSAKFQAKQILGKSIKCCLVAGFWGDRPAVAKVLAHKNPMWRWYFQREARIYQELPGFIGHPQFYYADIPRGILILERISSVCGPHRRVTIDLSVEAVDQLFSKLSQLNDWPMDAEVFSTPASRHLQEDMRRRLLEDPGSPLTWFIEGLERCGDLGILLLDDCEKLIGALESYPETAPCHGDLLPRNAYYSGTEWVLIDWECAGRHARDWDRALFWIGLDPLKKRACQYLLEGFSEQRCLAFRALVVFAYAREVKFFRKSRGARARAVKESLAAALDLFRSRVA